MELPKRSPCQAYHRLNAAGSTGTAGAPASSLPLFVSRLVRVRVYRMDDSPSFEETVRHVPVQPSPVRRRPGCLRRRGRGHRLARARDRLRPHASSPRAGPDASGDRDWHRPGRRAVPPGRSHRARPGQRSGHAGRMPPQRFDRFDPARSAPHSPTPIPPGACTASVCGGVPILPEAGTGVRGSRPDPPPGRILRVCGGPPGRF